MSELSQTQRDILAAVVERPSDRVLSMSLAMGDFNHEGLSINELLDHREQVKTALLGLEDRGLVEQDLADTYAPYRPTEKGKAAA